MRVYAQFRHYGLSHKDIGILFGVSTSAVWVACTRTFEGRNPHKEAIKKYQKGPKFKLVTKKHQKTQSYRDAQRSFQSSDKGKEARQRYYHSPKGRLALLRRYAVLQKQRDAKKLNDYC